MWWIPAQQLPAYYAFLSGFLLRALQTSSLARGHFPGSHSLATEQDLVLSHLKCGIADPDNAKSAFAERTYQSWVHVVPLARQRIQGTSIRVKRDALRRPGVTLYRGSSSSGLIHVCATLVQGQHFLWIDPCMRRRTSSLTFMCSLRLSVGHLQSSVCLALQSRGADRTSAICIMPGADGKAPRRFAVSPRHRLEPSCNPRTTDAMPPGAHRESHKAALAVRSGRSEWCHSPHTRLVLVQEHACKPVDAATVPQGCARSL
jgi:hypothetical protein